jgi:3-oxoacyl-[acyl-carrier-protein] synthase III
MHSATLPPDLATIAREAMRDGPPTPTPARPARVIGLGHHVPAEVVPNGAIAERIGVDDAWIVKRTGIKSRRRVAPSDRLSDLATFASRRALSDAGVEALDLDLVLVATMTPDEITPNAAPLVANALGAERAGAIDIGAACTGWLAALRLAAGQVETGRADRVLEATVAAVARAGLELDDVDLFVYHQANGRIIRAVGERLDLQPARVADYVAHMANTSAASIPLTLSLLREDGRLRPGQKVLVAAIGAGFTWGAGVLEWGVS